jgi:hypothetical protein
MNKERADDIVAYINPIVIKGLKRKPSEPVNEQPLLRSEKQFDFKEDCLLYGASVIENTVIPMLPFSVN